MTTAKSSLPLPQKLLLYSLGAGAASVAASAHGAAADVVKTYYTGAASSTYYFNLQNTTAASNSSSTGEQFEFTKGTKQASATGVNSANYVIATESKLGGSNGTTATDYVLKLGLGATIGSTATIGSVTPRFTTTGVFNNYYAGTTYNSTTMVTTRDANDGSNVGDWQSNSTSSRGFVGLRILTPGGKTEYGFADLTITNLFGPTGNFQLNGFAYDPTGDAITTVLVPEPGSTTALLVAGAAGAAALRRRRKPAATTEA